jgi:hypothetical protein
VLPVALELEKSLLKKIIIAVVIAAAETVLSGQEKVAVKRWSRGASPVRGAPRSSPSTTGSSTGRGLRSW